MSGDDADTTDGAEHHLRWLEALAEGDATKLAALKDGPPTSDETSVKSRLIVSSLVSSYVPGWRVMVSTSLSETAV